MGLDVAVCVVYCRRMTSTRLITIREAAALYRVSERTIQRWIASGELKSERPGGRTVRVVVEETES